jgi:hypothetical protein
MNERSTRVGLVSADSKLVKKPHVFGQAYHRDVFVN